MVLARYYVTLYISRYNPCILSNAHSEKVFQASRVRGLDTP